MQEENDNLRLELHTAIVRAKDQLANHALRDQLWVIGADTIVLNRLEGIGIASICIDPMVRLKMTRARDTGEFFLTAFGILWHKQYSPIELIPQTRWESLADVVQRLREIACIGGITRNLLPDMNDHFAVVKDWKGPDAAVMTVLIKNKFIEGAPAAYKSPLFTMFSALMGNATNVYTACSLISSYLKKNKSVSRQSRSREK
ncbi:unnamed protein product [Ranitomeya imitator]|uniref:Uncharacterized protein n=1 Tax=Ranitomeya imitator TaxID=111125 RepID=A0ABN9MH71_9NEOB|nr:unnamed protein product [Ranitomeya imitator]